MADIDKPTRQRKLKSVRRNISPPEQAEQVEGKMSEALRPHADTIIKHMVEPQEPETCSIPDCDNLLPPVGTSQVGYARIGVGRICKDCYDSDSPPEQQEQEGR